MAVGNKYSNPVSSRVDEQLHTFVPLVGILGQQRIAEPHEENLYLKICFAYTEKMKWKICIQSCNDLICGFVINLRLVTKVGFSTLVSSQLLTNRCSLFSNIKTELELPMNTYELPNL